MDRAKRGPLRAHHSMQTGKQCRDGGHGAKSAFVVLSQKVARFDFENQVFEKIQDWRARC